MDSKTQVSSICRALIAEDFCVFDTETTGIGETHQIIEISIVDQTGVVLDCRVNPTIAVDPVAAAIHGMNNSDLADFPRWPTIEPVVREALSSRKVLAFNSAFDLGMLASTGAAFNLDTEWVSRLKDVCVMKLAADYFLGGEKNRISLSNACRHAGLSWDDLDPHSAAGDATMTLRLVRFMAGGS
jgi:DNA polymerase-3 subunit epsilon